MLNIGDNDEPNIKLSSEHCYSQVQQEVLHIRSLQSLLMPLILVLTCTERELCFFLAGDFFCRLCRRAVFSPSSLSYIVITATFGRVGLLGLTGVGSGNGVSEVSVDMVLSVEELSSLSLDL